MQTNEFGRLLAQLRSAAGLTQTEFGLSLGHKSGSVVSKWENGVIVPYPKTIAKLSAALGVDPQRLLDARERTLTGLDEDDPGHPIRQLKEEVVLKHVRAMLRELREIDDPLSG